MDPIIRLRRDLHQHPEQSGAEAETANRIVLFFRPLRPDDILHGLGGNGVAFTFRGQGAGPTVMLRCELDALPIQEINHFSYRSRTAGTSHKCGHDGHMAILAAVGAELARQRPKRGRVVLLYQPAEENGHGAEAILRDNKFEQIRPDFAFALHNLPGFGLGDIIVNPGTVCCASRGMAVTLHGTTAHAAQPEMGNSPDQAMCRLIDAFRDLPTRISAGDELVLATVVAARLGVEGAFGTAPGEARVMATLRSETDATMDRIVEHSEKIVKRIAEKNGLRSAITYMDEFPATVNSDRAAQIVRQAAGGASVRALEAPLRWSEDFGHFTRFAEGALFGIGAGEKTPALHTPEYDFPEELIPMGAAVFLRIIQGILM